MDLTHQSTPYIIAYISSPRCRLHTLKCNGNSLGLRSVSTIIRAIERDNFGLLKVEMYANHLVDGQHAGDFSSNATTGEDDEEESVSPGTWKECENLLKRLLLRNEHLNRVTEKEALRLLRYARVLLIQSKIDNAHAAPRLASNSFCNTYPSIPDAESSYQDLTAQDPVQFYDTPSHSVFPFKKLPTELKLYILSFLAPTLSSAQRIRIYSYASSTATLPSVLSRLPGTGNRLTRGSNMCVADPSSLGFGMEAASGSKLWSVGGGGGCMNGKCMGAVNSVVCHREEERFRWLAAVGCCAFEPERGEHRGVQGNGVGGGA